MKLTMTSLGMGNSTTVSRTRHRWASNLAKSILCCCFKFLTLHSSLTGSSPLTELPRPPRPGTPPTSSPAAFRARREVCKEVEADAEGAFTAPDLNRKLQSSTNVLKSHILGFLSAHFFIERKKLRIPFEGGQEFFYPFKRWRDRVGGWAKKNFTSG